MKVNDTTTSINCDFCNRASLARNFDITSDSGISVCVWWAYPQGWLVLLDEEGSVVFACTPQCAKAFSEKFEK